MAAEGEPFPELIEVTITELQAKMRSGQLTARRLTEMYLERIKVIDTKTHSVIEINPDALAIADQLDKERKKGKLRSMMHGIPVLIKDNIDTADKMPYNGRVARAGGRTETQTGTRFVVEETALNPAP